MPTGYTAELMEKGQTFEDFTLRCARAFGALVLMRDDPMDAAIPKFEPSPHYQEAIDKSFRELVMFCSMSNEEAAAYGECCRAEAIQRNEEWARKDRQENERLLQMQGYVCDWEPPTPDHQELKKFMLQQIQISMHDLVYIEREIAKCRQKTASEYYTDAVASAKHSIDWYEHERAKEIERTNARNEWVAQLRESLKTKTAV